MSHVLFYFKEDLTYLTVSSLSKALPQNLQGSDLRKLTPKSCLTLSNGWKGVVVATSTNLIELDEIRDKLERKLSALDQSQDVSFSVLENQVDSECHNEEDAVGNQRESTFLVSHEAEGLSQDQRSDSEDEEAIIPSQLLLSRRLAKMNDNQLKTNKLLASLNNEVTKVRKLLARFVTEKYKTGAAVETPAVENETQDPVLHNGLDLLKAGRRNFEMTHFALHIARILWTDAELMEKRLFPKSQNIPPLSPIRSEKFATCIKRKYRLDDEHIEPAVRAVNQLALDIKNGKRKRKSE